MNNTFKQYNKKDLSNTIVEMKDMAPGDIGVVQDDPYANMVVMRSTSRVFGNLIISLTNIVPDNCWSGVTDNHIKVRLLKPGSTIRIKVRE